MSGTHGVEGYTGSAIQYRLMCGILADAQGFNVLLAEPLVTMQQAYADQVNVVGLLNLLGSASGQVTVAPGSIQVATGACSATNISPGSGNLYVHLGASGNSINTGSFTDAVAWQVAGLAPGTPSTLISASALPVHPA